MSLKDAAPDLAPPATKERVIEGVVTDDASLGTSKIYTFWTAPGCIGTPATLIIHEPVKEPSLYEAVEEMFRLSGEHEYAPVAGVRAAFNREKAARERGKA